jgi:hypothetical protein
MLVNPRKLSKIFCQQECHLFSFFQEATCLFFMLHKYASFLSSTYLKHCMQRLSKESGRVIQIKDAMQNFLESWEVSTFLSIISKAVYTAFNLLEISVYLRLLITLRLKSSSLSSQFFPFFFLIKCLDTISTIFFKFPS